METLFVAAPGRVSLAPILPTAQVVAWVQDQNLAREKGFSIIALGTAADFEVNQSQLNQIGVPSYNLSGRTTLLQSASLIRRCRLALGAETGLAHMACAVGTANVILM